MARFSIERNQHRDLAWLINCNLGKQWDIDRADADEIRRLLDEAFPPEQQPRDCTCKGACRGPEGLGEGWRCVLGKQQPATDDPDPDEVRWHCDDMEPHWQGEPARLAILAGARAWLRMRERDEAKLCIACGGIRPKQQPEPGPTIAQVIEACGATEVSVWDGRDGGDGYIAMGKIGTRVLIQQHADTPEAALRALYDDAVAKLKQQRDEAEQKLATLGVR